MSELLGAAPDDQSGLIKDATIESFEKDVLEASMQKPVIVDFWADWCGPCKQLAPVLEKAVMAAGGAVSLVKVDIDKNQMLASQLRIQSVPTVYAFFQGRPVDGFQGAVPESEIKAFISRLSEMKGGAAPQSPDVDDMLSSAEAAFDAGDVATAAQVFSQIAQANPDNVRALAGLARCHVKLGDLEKARQVIDLLPEEKRDDPALSGVLAAISLAGEDAPAGDFDELRRKVEADPSDHEARFDLATAQIAANEMEAGIDNLLAVIEKEPEWNEAAARKKLLTVFDALGPGDPLTVRGRRRLSSLLFS